MPRTKPISAEELRTELAENAEPKVRHRWVAAKALGVSMGSPDSEVLEQLEFAYYCAWLALREPQKSFAAWADLLEFGDPVDEVVMDWFVEVYVRGPKAKKGTGGSS